jgi:hypothetical protein
MVIGQCSALFAILPAYFPLRGYSQLWLWKDDVRQHAEVSAHQNSDVAYVREGVRIKPVNEGSFILQPSVLTECSHNQAQSWRKMIFASPSRSSTCQVLETTSTTS